MTTQHQHTRHVHVRVREFKTPPVNDGLILGRDAAVGCMAIRKTLELLSTCQFAHIEPDDEVVGDIIVREAILKRVPRDQLIRFILESVKPIMSSDEILEVDLDVMVEITGKWP